MNFIIFIHHGDDENKLQYHHFWDTLSEISGFKQDLILSFIFVQNLTKFNVYLIFGRG